MASIENGSWRTQKCQVKIGKHFGVSTFRYAKFFERDTQSGGEWGLDLFPDTLKSLSFLLDWIPGSISCDFIRFPCMQSYIYPEWNIWPLFQNEFDVPKSVRRLAVCFL